MTVFIPQAVQPPPPLASRRWGEPVRGETLAALADTANHIAAVKGATQTSCKIEHAGASLSSDPSGSGGTLWVMVPSLSGLSSRLEVVISYQGHEHAGAGIKVRLWGDGVILDPPGGGWAHELTTGAGIPAGGRRQAAGGAHIYPVRRASLAGARSLSLGAGAGSDLFVEIQAAQARVLAVWVGEEPRRVV